MGEAASEFISVLLITDFSVILKEKSPAPWSSGFLLPGRDFDFLTRFDIVSDSVEPFYVVN